MFNDSERDKAFLIYTHFCRFLHGYILQFSIKNPLKTIFSYTTCRLKEHTAISNNISVKLQHTVHPNAI